VKAAACIALAMVGIAVGIAVGAALGRVLIGRRA
jgi:hypothetical protein